MYCTKCGKKLEDGEVCTCTQKTQAPHMQADTAQVKNCLLYTSKWKY